MKYITSGKLAKLANINVESIRFYEKKKLMPKPVKSDSGYRLYSAEDLQRLKFIKKAQGLGFTLNEIKELMNLKITSNATCGDVKQLAENKLNDIKEKITELNKIKTVLIKMINQCVCEELSSDECPILEVIDAKS